MMQRTLANFEAGSNPLGENQISNCQSAGERALLRFELPVAIFDIAEAGIDEGKHDDGDNEHNAHYPKKINGEGP
jgi:hypothetical protein